MSNINITDLKKTFSQYTTQPLENVMESPHLEDAHAAFLLCRKETNTDK